jgi:hypothetical protein
VHRLRIGASFPACGCFRPLGTPSVRPADALAVHGCLAALRPAMLGARLAPRHFGAAEDDKIGGEIGHVETITSCVTECTVAWARAAC